MQSSDPAAITAQQQASWDRHVEAYTEVVIGKDSDDLATAEVISAVKKHDELAAGDDTHFRHGRMLDWSQIRQGRY